MATKTQGISRIYITPKDVQKVAGCSYRTALAKLNEIREAKGKAADKPITFAEFAEYEQILLHELMTAL